MNLLYSRYSLPNHTDTTHYYTTHADTHLSFLFYPIHHFCLHYHHSSVLYIHLPSLPLPPLFPSINRSIRTLAPIPTFPSLVSSFLPVPTPHFLPYPFLSPSIHPSHLNYAVATQLQCHCPRFNVNVVSLSQLLGHYHPSQLIIVIQIHGQTKHITENKGAQVENKGAHGKEKHVAVYDARVKFNLAL